MISQKLLDETKERYTARAFARKETEASLEQGGVALANDADQLERRLRRVGVEGPAEVAKAIMGDAGPARRDPTLERILGNNDLLGIAYLKVADRVARSVGCIRVRRADGRLLGSGTGFMVSPRLLMTNNHVLSDENAAQFSRVEFDYEDDEDGNRRLPVVFDLEPQVFFLTNEQLDYSLVAVKQVARDGVTPLQTYACLPLLADDAKVLKGEPLNIVQHPSGEPKQLALRANDLVDVLDEFLHYSTDTAPGSSGSPVFNDQWEVVALHHSGVPRRDPEGRILARGGGLWNETMGDQWIDWEANEGARVSRIVAHIAGRPLSGDAEALRKELLGAANRQPGRVERVEPVVKLDLETRGGNTSTRRLDPRPPPEPSPPVLVPSTSGGDATWTLPLEITIRLGQPGLKSSIVGSPASQPIVEKPQPAQRSELQAALAELAEAPTRPYYDEQADMEDQDRYYAGLPSDLNPAELFAALSRLVGAATDNVPRYAPARHLYPWIDLQPDLKIQSVYSGQQFEPEELIRDDFRMEQERAIRLSEIMVREATLSPEEVAAQLDELEAALPYNCEHVVCQSWFGKQEPMRGDLHHLFACESRCNSFRSNTPYYDFPDFMEAVRTECGKSEGERFEPESGKGKVARATLYFLLAYPGKINARFPVYDEERLRILLEWHRQFPVTPHEKHRNAAIFSRQDNRNPLVDYPEWADRIDFALSL